MSNSNYVQTSNNSQLLSKEDYLSLSNEYLTEKRKAEKKQHTRVAIGVIIMVIGFVSAPFLLIPLKSVFGILIGFSIGIVGIIFAITSFQKGNKTIENLGNHYYQKYVSQYNRTNA